MTGTAQTGRAAARPVAMVLPAADRAASVDELRELRRAFVGTARGGALPADALPVLLAPYREPERVRLDYPLLAHAAGDDVRCVPLAGLLRDLAGKATAQARVVQDNLLRLERQLRRGAAATPDRAPGDLLREAGEALQRALELREPIAAGLRSDLAAMTAALPEGRLLPLDAGVALELLRVVAAHRAGRERSAFGQRASALVEGVRRLLAVEAQKGGGSNHRAGALGRSLGEVSSRFLDPTAIARAVGPHRGTQQADAGRVQRLQEALLALEAHLAEVDPPPLELTHAGAAPVLLAAAAEWFDRAAARLVVTLRAARLAELELAGRYEPARHDPLLGAMDWRHCTAAELALLPVVTAMLPAEDLVGHGMQALVELIASGRPVQVLALRTTGDAQRFARVPIELAYFGVACREVYVQQASVARPAHMLAGFERALAGSRAGLHVVDTGCDASGQAPPLGAFVHAGAAIEARAQPLFHYDPDAGETWARRFDFDANPAVDDDWSATIVPCARPGVGQPGGGSAGGDQEDVSVAFTFADFVLLEPTLRDRFSLVPDALRSDELLPLARYLQLAPDAALAALPFVWVATAAGTLHRALVGRDVVQLCRDRLRFWHTLQELAGVRNEYVREAVERARSEAAATAAREQAELARAHTAELEQVRRAAAEDALAGLARSLLSLGPAVLEGAATAMVPTGATEPARPAAPAAMPTPATPPAAPTTAPAGVEAPDYEEAWIESSLCTSCNDCTNINSLLFVYNQNKQARIGDARAGTFAQLVQAAEKCPAHCIHPGAPLNPNEPDLDSLVRRAAPFNR